MNSFAFDAIGTSWVIDIYEEAKSVKLDTIKEDIIQRAEEYDKTYSRFRNDSFITMLSKNKGTFKLPVDAQPLLQLYKKLYDISGGYFTPLIGDVLIQAGYDASYTLQPHTLQKPYSWEESLSYKDSYITIKKPTMLDFGAAGKGYLIDLLGDILEKNTIKSYCIDGSGDILYKHSKKDSIRIGLEHPENPKQVLGVATIKEGALCGSAGNRRKWDKYHHIMDPHLLTSPSKIKAVWTTADTALLADGLTTCLFFIEPEVLKKHFSFEYVILYNDYTIKKSDTFPGEFFIK